MSKIALVTDSSCDLPIDLLQKWNIRLVPLRLIYADREYRDGVDITPNEVYDRLVEEIPTTSMPTPEEIVNTFRKLEEEGYTHAVVLALSANLSGTYNAFRLAAEEVQIPIHVIDSKGLSWVLGFQVLEAARMIREKVSFEELVTKLEETKAKIKGYFIVDSLEYLRKGGRIGKVAASLGSILNLKPIISLDPEGNFYSHSIARGKNQAIKKLLNPVLKQIETTKVHISILQGRAEQEAEALRERLKGFDNVSELYVSTISPALVVHTGPGLLGLVVHPLEEDNGYAHS
jgi:DegV family protein with EDD domain